MTDQPDRITDEELAEIQARADAATPGPWTPQSMCSNPSKPGGVEDWGSTETAGLGFDVSGPPEPILDRYRFESGWDALFVAHTREDVPRLVAALRSCRDELRAAQAVNVQQIAAGVLSEYGLHPEDVFHAATRIAELVEAEQWAATGTRNPATS